MRNKKLLFIIVGAISILAVGISNAATPYPPVTISPGETSGPGPVISDLTPTFSWNAGTNAVYYGLYISEWPYGTENLVFDSEVDFGLIYGTIFTLPESNKLEPGKLYRWNMASYNSEGWSYDLGTGFSERRYFQTEAIPPDLIVDDIWTEPTEFDPGDTVKLYSRVKNIGATATIGFKIKRYFDDKHISTYTRDEKVFHSGASFNTYSTYTWPSDSTLHTIRVEVDPDNTVSESNENNNEWSEQFSAEKPTPTISRSPTSLFATCQEGQDASPDSFEVWNSGSGILNYTISIISDDVGWQPCPPVSGSSSGEHDTVNVYYNTSDLLEGSYYYSAT